MRLLSQDDIDFTRARPVVSAAQKFVISVPAFDGDPLVYPPGTDKAGEPITDWQGNPIRETGILFFNEIDQCYQAAPADGRSVIIINEVTAEQVRSIEHFVNNLGKSLVNLCKRSLELLLAHVRSRLGLVDIYNSTDELVRLKMVPVSAPSNNDRERPSGWMRRDDQDICHAVFVRGPARFAGPAATPQEIPSDGAFVVRQATTYRMVDSGTMLRTYMNLDSSPLNLSDFLVA